MVQADPRLARITTITDSLKLIRHPMSDGILKAVSSESYTKMGMSISCLICDELATWSTGDRDLYNALVSSQGKRTEPITLIITTAGVGRGSIAWDIYSYARRVAAGEVEDGTFLPVLFEIAPDTDWRDRATWAEINPAIASGFRSLEEMEVSAGRAEHIPAQVASFERLYLNRWLDGSATPWLDLSIWDEGEQDVAPSEGARCWIGVDLASVSDLAAVVAVWEHGEGYYCRPAFFCPETGMRRRSERDGVPYALWAEQGHLVATPGSVIDYAHIEQHIAELAERYRVQVIIDRWNSTSTVTRLQEAGLDVVTMGQGYASLSPAMKETERLILARQIAHDGNPIMRWNLGNIAVVADPAGNIKPDRARSKDKVDGVLGLIMSIGVAAASPSGSVYEMRPSFLWV
jgi:phage terminase large subunit-like protein